MGKSLAGWWLSHPSEKYESQLGLLFPIYGKKKFQTTNQLGMLDPIVPNLHKSCMKHMKTQNSYGISWRTVGATTQKDRYTELYRYVVLILNMDYKYSTSQIQIF